MISDFSGLPNPEDIQTALQQHIDTLDEPSRDRIAAQFNIRRQPGSTTELESNRIMIDVISQFYKDQATGAKATLAPKTV